MNDYLFKDLDLNPQNIHFPNVYTNDKTKAAQDYETAIKNFNGIDFQLITLGINGHMAYNEPGTPLDTYTHVAKLSDETRNNLVAKKKFSDLKTTPTEAMTVGVKTILEMRQVILASFGTSKAEMTRRMLQEPITPKVTSSALQKHKNCVFILDQEAASKLKKDDKKYHLTFIE
jgi:glucosamine-6-phosphate deaminase